MPSSLLPKLFEENDFNGCAELKTRSLNRGLSVEEYLREINIRREAQITVLLCIRHVTSYLYEEGGEERAAKRPRTEGFDGVLAAKKLETGPIQEMWTNKLTGVLRYF